MDKKSINYAGMIAVASVLFGWHAGGGFATGNQANQFFIISGRLAPFSALLTMLLLTLTIRQALIMYSQRSMTSVKQLFETLYHPLDKLAIVFEIYYCIMVLMATSSSIAGAATLLVDMFNMNYVVSILVVGVILLSLTMFGADLVRKASSVMSVLIIVCAFSIFMCGIALKRTEISVLFSAVEGRGQLSKAILKAFQYAGFQCAAIPTMVACSDVLRSKKECVGSMWISFAMNAIATVLSVVMLLVWQSVYSAIEGGTTIPTLTVCKEMGIGVLLWAYYIFLFLCFISTGVGAVFGVVAKFESNAKLVDMVSDKKRRRMGISIIMMATAMMISFVGLTNIIKYGYGYCGYIGIAIIVIPFLTVGVYKNRRYKQETSIAD